MAGGVATFLGPEQVRLLLRPADEHHSLRGDEAGQLLGHHIVLALTLDEVDPRNGVRLRERVDLLDEAVGDLAQRSGRGDRQPQLMVHIADQPGGVLQPRHIHVAIHPVDALDLEGDMLG